MIRLLLCSIAFFIGGASALAQPTPKKAYTPVRVSITDLGARDPSFITFRDRMREIIRARDRSAWRARVSPRFRFLKDLGGGFDPKKTPVQNAEHALRFDAVDENGKPDRDAGWKNVEAFFARPFGYSEIGSLSLCAPARPRYSESDFTRLLKTTKTSPLGDWEAIGANVNVYAAPRHTAPVIERTGLIFIRMD